MTLSSGNIQGLLPDHEILRLCREVGLLDPHLPKKDYESPSSGPSSYGYDIRLGPRYTTFKRTLHLLDYITPANCASKLPEVTEYHNALDSEHIILAPGQFILAHSVETFTMPSDITAFVKDKSTYARMGIAVQNTVIEPGWSGQLTLEITNHAPFPVGLEVNKGIAQVCFVRGKTCELPYSAFGKYQDQEGVTLPK